MKRKILLILGIVILTGMSAMAQKVSTRVIDNKGTIKWVIDSATAVVTRGDSTLLYVTPKQLRDSAFIKAAANGLTKIGQTAELGGTLSKPTTITTTATNFLAITGLQAGSTTTDSLMVVNPTTGQVSFISPTALFNALTFSNGLTKTGNEVKLGGALTGATTITTDATNVLKIGGLQGGSLATDSIVVADATDGTLKRVSSATLLQSGDTNITATTNGQATYTVPNMPANASRVWVYRSGAKLLVTEDYTAAAGTLTLTTAMAALVVTGGVIEVQWVK